MTFRMDNLQMDPITSIKIPDSEASDYATTLVSPPFPSSDSSDSGFSSTSSGSSSPQQFLSPQPLQPSPKSETETTPTSDHCSEEVQDTSAGTVSKSVEPAVKDPNYFSEYLHFCMNRSDGCEEQVRLSDMCNHLKMCLFKPLFPCFLDQGKDSCSWRLSESSRPRSAIVLIEHFEKEHQVVCLTVPTTDFTGILTLPCYSAHMGFQQVSSIPSFIATHILWYQNTWLLFAMRLLEEHVEVWLWDLEGKWVGGRRNLQLLCRLSTPPGAVSEPEWQARQVDQDPLSEPKLEPVPVELDVDGQVVLPEDGLITFTYRDIYDCGIAPWLTNADVDWFQIKLDLF